MALCEETGTAGAGLDERAAADLARLAGTLRAEAANGLHWGARGRVASCLRSIRRTAAGLLAVVDHRPLAWIESATRADSGLRTPIPGFEFRIRFPDGSRESCARRLRPGESFAEWSRTFASELDASGPVEFLGFSDTDAAGLPCPHTFLAVYEIEVDGPRGGLGWEPPPSDADLQALTAVEPKAHGLSGARSRTPVRVPLAVKSALDGVADRARRALGHADGGYEAERFERILATCAGVEPAAGEYPRIDCGDLAAYGWPTGSEAAVSDARGRLLLMRRTGSGQWAIPGGACEVGESVDRTAVREAFEETGLHVELTGLVGIFDTPLFIEGRLSPLVVCFSAKAAYPGQRIRLEEREAVDARWFTEAEARNLDFFAGHRQRVAKAFAAMEPGSGGR